MAYSQNGSNIKLTEIVFNATSVYLFFFSLYIVINLKTYQKKIILIKTIN